MDCLSWIFGGDPRRTSCAHRRLGYLIDWCPDKAAQIAEIIIVASDDLLDKPNNYPIVHLARAARIRQDKIDEIVERLLRYSYRFDISLVREAAMQALAKAAQLCPSKRKDLAIAVLLGCNDRNHLVRKAAVGHWGLFSSSVRKESIKSWRRWLDGATMQTTKRRGFPSPR